MRKCNVCGRRFRLLAKNRYEIIKSPIGLECLTQGVVHYNAFDCPHCGCQNIVGEVEKARVMEVKAHPLKTVTNEKEAQEYQIGEDISKSFEDFTRMIFEQGEGV